MIKDNAETCAAVEGKCQPPAVFTDPIASTPTAGLGEPVAWLREIHWRNHKTGIVICDPETEGSFPVYRHAAPTVAPPSVNSGDVREALIVVARYIDASKQASVAWEAKSEFELRDQADAITAALRKVLADMSRLTPINETSKAAAQVSADLFDAEMLLNGIATGYHAEGQTELSTVMATDAQRAIDLLKSAKSLVAALTAQKQEAEHG